MQNRLGAQDYLFRSVQHMHKARPVSSNASRQKVDSARHMEVVKTPSESFTRMIHGPAKYLALGSLCSIRGNGCGCFCAKVLCGFDGPRVANFLDYLRQSFTRET